MQARRLFPGSWKTLASWPTPHPTFTSVSPHRALPSRVFFFKLGALQTYIDPYRHSLQQKQFWATWVSAL